MAHIWFLSSLTKDWTYIPCMARWIPNYWTTREGPIHTLLIEVALRKNLLQTHLIKNLFKIVVFSGSPPGFPVPGILQARTLEWVAISFSNAWKWKVKVKSLSHVRLLVTPWTAAYQAPPSMGFSKQEYWSGKPLPSPLFILIRV